MSLKHICNNLLLLQHLGVIKIVIYVEYTVNLATELNIVDSLLKTFIVATVIDAHVPYIIPP